MKLTRRNFIKAIGVGLAALLTPKRVLTQETFEQDDEEFWDTVYPTSQEPFDPALWDAMLNDDLDALREVPAKFAREAQEKVMGKIIFMDDEYGDDANDGLSPKTAFKTHDRALRAFSSRQQDVTFHWGIHREIGQNDTKITTI